LRYKRSEALPDFTVDLAKGIVVAEGVPAAALTSSFGQLTLDLEGARWLVKETFGAVADAGVQQAFGGYVIGRISITASKTRLTSSQWVPRSVQRLFRDIRTLKGTGEPQTVWSQFLMTTSEADELTATIAGFKSGKPGPGSASKWWPRVRGRMVPLDLIVSFALAGVIEGGFSLYGDIQMRDIYGLTDQQIAQRALVRVGGGLLAVYVGMTVAGLVSVPFMPVMAVGIVVALAVQVAWDWGPVQVMFQAFDLYGPYEPRPRSLDLNALQRRRFIR
jgi:hypothetical protein